MKRSDQSGYTLLEMAIVLAIMGVIVGGVWTVAHTGSERARTELLLREIDQLVLNTRAFYASFAKMPTAVSQICMTSCLIAQNMAPREMVRTNSTETSSCTGGGSCAGRLDNPWGPNSQSLPSGGVLIGPDTSNAQQFIVELRGLPRDGCVSIALRLSDMNGPHGLVSLTVNGSALTLPTTPKASLTLCGANTTPVIKATYRLRYMR